jgi:hypothetical protein
MVSTHGKAMVSTHGKPMGNWWVSHFFRNQHGSKPGSAMDPQDLTCRNTCPVRCHRKSWSLVHCSGFFNLRSYQYFMADWLGLWDSYDWLIALRPGRPPDYTPGSLVMLKSFAEFLVLIQNRIRLVCRRIHDGGVDQTALCTALGYALLIVFGLTWDYWCQMSPI